MTLLASKSVHIYNIIINRKPIFTSEGNLRGGLSSWHQNDGVGMRCPHIWPHPGLTNLESGRVHITYHYIRSAGTLSA